jgi:OOP family OmpA-OmpF porin
MNKIVGMAVLAIGLTGLGIWGSIVDAPRIEAKVRAGAEAALAQAGSGAEIALTVRGRDVYAAGTASNDGGAQALRAALGAAPGLRVLRDDFTDLAIAAPFFLTVEKGQTTTATGYVPSEALRSELAAALGGAATAPLVLARGAPDGWPDLARAGLKALGNMTQGRLSIEGTTVILVGEVTNQTQAQAVDAALGPVAMVIKDITVLDDGLPIAYDLTLDSTGRAMLNGKLPVGVVPQDVATALGLAAISGSAQTARIGAAGDIGFLSAWASALPHIEEMTAKVGPQGRSVQAKLRAGADVAAVMAALQSGDFAVQIDVPEPASKPEPEPKPLAPAQPVAVAVPMSPLGFEITLNGCQGATDALLAQTTIIFLPNLDTLEPSAAAVIENLAAIARDCTGAALRAEVGGHTDTSGDADENIALSARRAEAVRAALVAAGVPDMQIEAAGYGSAQPISENETPEGRAKNRRTTLVWRK